MSHTPPNGRFAPRPAAGRARGRLSAAGVAALVCSLSIALAGCAPSVSTAPASIAASGGPGPRTSAPSGIPTPSASPARSVGPTPDPTLASAGPDLLLLTSENDVATLHLVRLSGEVVPVPLPDPSVVAVAPIAGGQLMALLRDGRAFVAPRGPAGLAAGSGWHALTLRGPAAMPKGQIVRAARSSPNGTRVAALTGPRDRMAPTALVVIESATGRREIHALADESQGGPAWTDSSHVMIVKRDRYDSVYLARMNAATGRVTDRLRIRALGFETSGDGRTSAALGDAGVVVGPTASVLATRRLPDLGPAMPADNWASNGIALSRDGRLIAILIRSDTGPQRLAIYEQAAGEWHAGALIELAASVSFAVPTWLP